MNRGGFASAGAAGDPGDEALLLHQVTAPALSAAPNPGDHDSAGAQGQAGSPQPAPGMGQRADTCPERGSLQ